MEENKPEILEQPTPVKKKRGRKPKVQTAEGISFDAADSVVEIRCKYSDRERFAYRLFEEYGTMGQGLLLRCDKCGCSINYQAPDRVPTMNVQCGSRRHVLIRWISID